MNVRDLTNAMERIAPTAAAEAWDNVGLLVGDPDAALTGVCLCIDLTAEVFNEARQLRANAVVAYHPPIFKGAKRLLAGDVEHGVVFDAIRTGVAIYSPHTALDVAAGGTNDVLADCLYLTNRRPLRSAKPDESNFKLVVFVPEEATERVADALFDAGAGSIGSYSRCSFRSRGQGTFMGDETTNPSIGQPGQLERVEEVRLEMIVSSSALSAVVKALRESHPYETPAFDLLRVAVDQSDRGMGRIGDFDEPVPRDVLIGRIRRELGVDHVLVAGPIDGEVHRIAVCAGSCGSEMLDEVARQGAELYLTGELRHHDALRAQRLGITVVCVLHSNSERATLERLRRRLESELPGVPIAVSETDRDPFCIL